VEIVYVVLAVLGIIFVLPIVSIVKVRNQSDLITMLSMRVTALEAALKQERAVSSSMESPTVEPVEEPVATDDSDFKEAFFSTEDSFAFASAPPQSSSVAKSMESAPVASVAKPQPMAPPVAEIQPSVEAEKQGMEWRLGARLPVWLGGVALILSGFFLVKYSIEQGLIGPVTRCVMAGVFGVVLQVCGHALRRREGVVDRERMSMSLAGAGLAVLYGALYAATTVYAIIPTWLGFAGMVVVTGLAVIQSLFMGQAIAILGLAGGFATPLMVGSQSPSPILFFGYLLILHFAILVLCRRRGYLLTAFLSIAGVGGWSLYWAFRVIASSDLHVLHAFVLADACVVVWALWQRSDEKNGDLETVWRNPWALLSIVTMGLALCSTSGFLVQYANSIWNLCFLLVLSAGVMVLAFFRERTYLPAVYLAAGLLAFVAHKVLPDAPSYYLIWLAAHGGLFCIGGGLALSRSRIPLAWTPLVLGSALSTFNLAHYRFAPIMEWSPFVWAGMAAALGCVALYCAPRVKRLHDDRQTSMAGTAFAWMGSYAFIWAVYYGVPAGCHPSGFAALVLASVVLWRFFREEPYRFLPLVHLIALTVFMFPKILEPLWLVVFGTLLTYPSSISFLYSPWLSLGAPLVILIVSLLVSRDLTNKSQKAITLSIVILAPLFLATVFKILFNDPGTWRHLTSIMENSLVTNCLFAMALGCFYVALRYKENDLNWAGLALGCGAVWRVLFIDLFHNPWLSQLPVGDLPIINLLLVEYVPPVLWMLLLARFLAPLNIRAVSFGPRILSLVVVFTLVSLEVRQFFHPGLLHLGVTSSVEIYSYSAAWIILAMFFLVAGTLRQDRMLRLASLCLMAPSVGKIFLYDASALTGLLRAFSFLGLGVCLLVIGWFYSQFVFNDQPLTWESFKQSWKAFLPFGHDATSE